MANNPSTDDILKKYGAKIERQMKGFNNSSGGGAAGPGGEFSQSYKRFRASMIPSFTRYEKWAKALGNVFHMKVGEKDKGKIDRAIEVAHLNLSASEVVVFATMALFLTLFGGVLFFVGIWLLGGGFSLMLLFLVFILSIFSVLSSTSV